MDNDALVSSVGSLCTIGARDCCDQGRAAGCNLFCSLVETSDSVCTRFCSTARDCGGAGFICMPSDEGYGVCATVSQWWMIGMAFCFSGTLISNLGSQFQKVALRKHKHSMNKLFRQYRDSSNEDDKKLVAEAQGRPPIRMPVYMLGALMMATGSLLDILALAFAAQSLIASLAASTFAVTIVSPALEAGRAARP